MSALPSLGSLLPSFGSSAGISDGPTAQTSPVAVVAGNGSGSIADLLSGVARLQGVQGSLANSGGIGAGGVGGVPSWALLAGGAVLLLLLLRRKEG